MILMANSSSKKEMNPNSKPTPIYLNNAATSFPKAPGLGKEVASLMSACPKHPGRAATKGEDILYTCRQEVARLISTNNPNRIILCKSSTEALNIAICGIDLHGSTVVTTAMEHNSVLRPLYRLEHLKKISLIIVGCTDQGRVNEAEWKQAIINYTPRLVVLNHASNVTGAVNNAESLLGFARKNGALTLLDASQTMGIITVDSTQIPADMITFTGHKYLLGPTGTGGLYVKEGLSLEPVIVGGTGIHSDLKTMPPEMPQKLEAGTPSVPLFGGLLHALKWAASQPEYHLNTAKYLSKLETGLKSIGARQVNVQGSRTLVVSFHLPGWDNEDISYILDNNYSIISRFGLHCAPLIHRYIDSSSKGTIRFSLSRFTREEEIDTTLEAMKDFKQ